MYYLQLQILHFVNNLTTNGHLSEAVKNQRNMHFILLYVGVL